MAANLQLVPMTERGWRSGFSNMLGKELGEWWATAKWWKQSLLWTLLVNGLAATVAASATYDPGVEMDPVTASVQFLANLGMAVIAIGVIVSVQSAIIGERQSGTAELILSKPLSRTAFVLAKFFGNAAGYLGVGVILQGAVWYGQAWFWGGKPVPVGPLLGAMGLMTLHTFFYIALTLMLGTLFQKRGTVSGAALGVLFAGYVLPGFGLTAALFVAPWGLPAFAMALLDSSHALGEGLPPFWWISILATALYTVICLAVAVTRFERDDL